MIPAEKVYALLLRLYPMHFRRMYGEEALQLVRDRMRDERGLWAKARLWWDLLADFVQSAPREYGHVPVELAAAGERLGGVPLFWVLEDAPMRAGTWAWASVFSLLLVGTSGVMMDHAGGHPLGFFTSAGRNAAGQTRWVAKPNGAGMPQGDSDVELIGNGVPRSQTPGTAGSAGEAIRAVAAGTKLEFDVASVKINKSDGMPSENIPLGPGAAYAPNGGNFIATNTPLIVYILFAYNMAPGSAQAMEKQVPSWVMTEKYDITAKTDKHDATKDEMRMMMRALLAERFKLAVHSETEQVPVFALTLAKRGTLGPKLMAYPSSEPCEPLGEKALPTDTVAGGFPAICGGIVGLPNSTPGMTTLGARNVPIEQLAGWLAGFGNLGRPVQDQTGLTGTYDFLLEYALERRLAPADAANASAPDTVGPGLEQALKQQLGLKLESKKGDVEVWVVDHVERPTQN